MKSKYRKKDVAFIDIVKGDKIDMLLSVVSLRAATFVPRSLLPFPVLICIFPRFSQSSFGEWLRGSCLVAKRSVVIFSSKTIVYALSSKFKVLN